jgi:hypothetical protein
LRAKDPNTAKSPLAAQTRGGLIPAQGRDDGRLVDALKRVAIVQIRSLRFSFLFLRMSLSQNRCTLLRDMR